MSYYFLAEFGPVFSFFIAAQFFSFYLATGILTLTTIFAVAATWQHDRRVPVMPLLSGAFVLISGVITLIYRAPDVLIISDSLFYFLIAALIGVGLLYKKLILKRYFKYIFAMDDTGWRLLSYRWLYLCLLAGVLNELVRFYMTIEFWVNYKFVKVIIITLFGIYQFTLARKYRIKNISNKWGVRNELLDKN